MKTITLVLSLIFINLIQTNPFDQFLKKIPDGWSSNIDKNRLVISRDSSVKIQYFNYGMEANPPILDHKMEIVIEYKKRLNSKEVEKRKNQRDRLLLINKKRLDLEPTNRNRAKFEMIKDELNTNKRYLIPIYSDEKYSYFMQDNFPYGYIYVNESEKIEIDELISELRKKE